MTSILSAPPPARPGQPRYAVQAGTHFAPLSAGITQQQPALEQASRFAHYFATGAKGPRGQSAGVTRVFCGVYVPGDPAQDAVTKAAQQGAQLLFLYWRDGLPAAHIQRSGNGFLFAAVPSMDSDGAFALGSGEGIRFTLTQCGAPRPGTVEQDKNGCLSFAPLGAKGGAMP